ncbi:MAG: hypothetical protein KA885_07975 [Spirochaetes bacterium]|nr:hypothetical protein [Spirochaetota bacterium]
MNDFLLLKSIGEGIVELKSKFYSVPDSEKDKISAEIEKLSNEYKNIYQLSLKNSLIVTEKDILQMEKLRKEINTCSTVTEILETVKNLFLFIFGISSNIISNMKN